MRKWMLALIAFLLANTGARSEDNQTAVLDNTTGYTSAIIHNWVSVCANTTARELFQNYGMHPQYGYLQGVVLCSCVVDQFRGEMTYKASQALSYDERVGKTIVYMAFCKPINDKDSL